MKSFQSVILRRPLLDHAASLSVDYLIVPELPGLLEHLDLLALTPRRNAFTERPAQWDNPRMPDQSDGPTPHEANYNLIAAALATAAATMLTLLTTLGTTSLAGNPTLKALLEAQLLVIELALILSVVSLIRPGQETKRKLVLTSAALVVLGTLLLWVSATSIILAQ